MSADDFVKSLSQNEDKEKKMDDFVKSYEMDLIKKHEAKRKNLKTTGALDLVNNKENENKNHDVRNGDQNDMKENFEKNKKEAFKEEMKGNEESKIEKAEGENEKMDDNCDNCDESFNKEPFDNPSDPKDLRTLWDNFLRLKKSQESEVYMMKETFSEVDFQVNKVRKCVGDHQLLWRVRNFSELVRNSKPLISPLFDSHRNGYKMQVILSQNKAGSGKAALSLHFCIWKGNSDPFLPWPYACPMTFIILNLKKIKTESEGRANKDVEKVKEGEAMQSYSKHFDPRIQSLQSPCLQKPITDRNKNIGFANFVSMFHLNNGDYIENDTVYIKVLIDLSEV